MKWRPQGSAAGRVQWQWPALAIRALLLAAGVAAMLVIPHARPSAWLFMALGLVVAVVSPGRAGAAVALLAAVVGWLFAYGAHGSPPVWRVALFALALYLLHESSALAGAVPATAQLRPEVLLGWLRRSLLCLVVAAGLAGVVYGAGGLSSDRTSYPLQVAGLFGTVLVLAAAAWLFTRTPR